MLQVKRRWTLSPVKKVRVFWPFSFLMLLKNFKKLQCFADLHCFRLPVAIGLLLDKIRYLLGPATRLASTSLEWLQHRSVSDVSLANMLTPKTVSVLLRLGSEDWHYFNIRRSRRLFGSKVPKNMMLTGRYRSRIRIHFMVMATKFQPSVLDVLYSVVLHALAKAISYH